MKTAYNKSKIMSNAWKLVKATAVTLSEGLKTAWKMAKSTVSESTSRSIDSFEMDELASIFKYAKRWTKGTLDRLYFQYTNKCDMYLYKQEDGCLAVGYNHKGCRDNGAWASSERANFFRRVKENISEALNIAIYE